MQINRNAFSFGFWAVLDYIGLLDYINWQVRVLRPRLFVTTALALSLALVMQSVDNEYFIPY